MPIFSSLERRLTRPSDRPDEPIPADPAFMELHGINLTAEPPHRFRATTFNLADGAGEIHSETPEVT
jgi:hypothetical protein